MKQFVCVFLNNRVLKILIIIVFALLINMILGTLNKSQGVELTVYNSDATYAKDWKNGLLLYKNSSNIIGCKINGNNVNIDEYKKERRIKSLFPSQNEYRNK